MKCEPIDWHIVPDKQLAIHDRLLNWARWCQGKDPEGSADVSPMFAYYRSTDANQGDGARYGLRKTSTEVNARDAFVVSRGVAALPEPHRRSLQWYYVKPVSPLRACREIATTMAGLAQLVSDGRQMLVNRGV